MIVIDASALVASGQAIERLVGEDLAAPHLLDAEVGTVIRRKTLGGELDVRLGRQALEDFGIALAESLDVPLITLDTRMAAPRGLRAAIEVIPTIRRGTLSPRSVIRRRHPLARSLSPPLPRLVTRRPARTRNAGCRFDLLRARS